MVAAGIMEYSRHKEGEPDARGTRSMMEIHADAQRQAMQEAGLGALRRLVPKASAPTCLAALEATGWNADEAYKHLKAFLEVEEKAKKDAAADAKREEKKRKREASKKSRRDESPSRSAESGSSDSESSSSSSSSSSRERRRRKKSKKHKKHKKHKKRRRKEASSSDDEDDRKASRKRGKRRRASEEKKTGVDFCARGVIRETEKTEKETDSRRMPTETNNVSDVSATKSDLRGGSKARAPALLASGLAHCARGAWGRAANAFARCFLLAPDEPIVCLCAAVAAAHLATESDALDDETENETERCAAAVKAAIFAWMYGKMSGADCDRNAGARNVFGAGNSIPCVPGHRRSDWREAPECQLAFENDRDAI